MHFYPANCGIVTSYNLPLGMWISPGTNQTHPGISICVASELQPFLTINIGNIDWVSNFPCKQPTHSLWVRCYLHPSRVTFNPKPTVMKHLYCQKRVCLPSLSPATLLHPFPYNQHCPDPVSSQLRPSCSAGWALLAELPEPAHPWVEHSSACAKEEAGARDLCGQGEEEWGH